MKWTRPIIIVIVAAAFAGVLVAGVPSWAICPDTASQDPAQAFAAASVVFVGTVESVTNADRFATVRVEEVLKGPALAGTVEVRGGPEDPNLNTGNDRRFTVGAPYVFFPANTSTPFQDNICTATRERTEALVEQLRGGDGTLPRTGVTVPIARVVAAALFAIAAGAVALGKRRNRSV